MYFCFVYNNNSLFLILMFWSFCLMPYQNTPICSVPNIILQDPPAEEPQNIEQTYKVEENTVKHTGIQINLTPQELLQAGYQTNKKAWNQEEDQLLMKLFKKGDSNWKQIADKIPGRTSKMCYSRYRRIQSQNKKLWSPEQDAIIKEAILKYGFDWAKISQFFPKKSGKQVQDHYNNYLRPGINKEPWTYEEDLLLMELLKSYGKNWQLIEGKLSGRTHNQIKNRYYGRLKRIQDKKFENEKKNILQMQ